MIFCYILSHDISKEVSAIILLAVIKITQYSRSASPVSNYLNCARPLPKREIIVKDASLSFADSSTKRPGMRCIKALIRLASSYARVLG